jgi:hypothetical protein
MLLRGPISHHLDLYRYWIAKRASRAMPGRRDLDPADIPALLSHLIVVEKVDDQLRYRLVGTAAAREVGYDATGSFVGSYLSSTAPESAAAARAVFRRVFNTAHPIFATGEFQIKSDGPHSMSMLSLPLSDDGTKVNMVISTLIAHFNPGVAASSDWLRGVPIKVRDVVNIDSIADLEKRCLDWERRCAADDPVDE